MGQRCVGGYKGAFSLSGRALPFCADTPSLSPTWNCGSFDTMDQSLLGRWWMASSRQSETCTICRSGSVGLSLQPAIVIPKHLSVMAEYEQCVQECVKGWVMAALQELLHFKSLLFSFLLYFFTLSICKERCGLSYVSTPRDQGCPVSGLTFIAWEGKI